MPRLLRSSPVLLAGALALGGLGVPAQAADPTAITVSSGPGVLYPDCVDHPINYSVSPPLENVSWKIELTYQAPDGTAAGNGFISKGDPTTGVETESFCGGDNIPGTYTVTGVYSVTTFQGSRVNTVTTPVTPFTFDLRLAQTQVTAEPAVKKTKIGKKVKVRVKVSDERPQGGFFGTSNASVYLQRQKGSTWVSVRGAKDYTGSTGSVLLRYKHTWKGKTKLRAVANVHVLGTNTSETFTVKAGR